MLGLLLLLSLFFVDEGDVTNGQQAQASLVPLVELHVVLPQTVLEPLQAVKYIVVVRFDATNLQYLLTGVLETVTGCGPNQLDGQLLVILLQDFVPLLEDIIDRL